MTYSERLKVPAWWLVIAVGFIASLAVAVFAYLPVYEAALLCGFGSLALLLGLFGYSRTRLTVDASAFSAGRYRLETAYIAKAEALQGSEAVAAIGPQADHRAFLFTRPFVKDLVRVTLADPIDPHPYWLVSTRRPVELAAAIESVRAA